MPDGTVGGGHQNRYLPTGFAHSGHDVVKYHKEEGKEDVNWMDSRCWNAGTPISWPPEANTRETLKAGVAFVVPEVVRDPNGRGVQLLATKNEAGAIVDYHPLIQFFNVVTADLINYGLHEHLKKVNDPKMALIIWKYFEGTYVNFTQSPAFKAFLMGLQAELKARLAEIEAEEKKGVKENGSSQVKEPFRQR